MNNFLLLLDLLIFLKCTFMLILSGNKYRNLIDLLILKFVSLFCFFIHDEKVDYQSRIAMNLI